MRKFFFRKIVFVLSILFFIVIFKVIPHEFFELGGDSAQYIILAENIARGGGYRAINYPQEPFFYHYPPLFPLLLSFVIYFYSRNIYLMHFLIALMSYVSLFFIYGIFKQCSGKKKAFLYTILLATNWVCILYSTKHILSDIPYFFISSVCLFFTAKYLKTESVFNKEGAFTLIALVLGYFMRYIGITLFLGIVILLIVEKARFKKIIFMFLGFLIPFFLWQMFNPGGIVQYSKQIYLIDPYRPYLGTVFLHPQYLLLRFVEGAVCFYKSLAVVLFPFFSGFSSYLSLITLVFIFIGVWSNKKCVFRYYFIIYVFLIMVWPYREIYRLLIPVIPFIYFYFFSGLDTFLLFLFKKKNVFVFYPAAVIILCFNVLKFPEYFIKEKLSQSALDFIAIHSWIKQYAPKNAVIISRKPTVSYFYSGRKSVIYPFSLDIQKIEQEFLKADAEYIIVDDFSEETRYYLLPFIVRYKHKLEIAHQEGRTSLLKILKE
ncbi:MAG: glycosyltransferase family 39 protein [Candidatus Saelkia tenebricola]|nr:glycosyltransferase family 39 protein [Candidatus Saelkia tenebricola]